MVYQLKAVEKPADRDTEDKNLNLKGLVPFSFFFVNLYSFFMQKGGVIMWKFKARDVQKIVVISTAIQNLFKEKINIKVLGNCIDGYIGEFEVPNNSQDEELTKLYCYEEREMTAEEKYFFAKAAFDSAKHKLKIAERLYNEAAEALKKASKKED